MKNVFRGLQHRISGPATPQQERFFQLLGILDSEPPRIIREYASAASLSEKGDAICLSGIETVTSERGKGNASRLLKLICDCADQAQVELLLRVEPKGIVGLTKPQLFSWYRRFGFSGDTDEMTRPFGNTAPSPSIRHA